MKIFTAFFAILPIALFAALSARPRAARAEAAPEDEAATIVVSDGARETVFALNGSGPAKSLLSQLPLTVEVQNYGGNEKIFYPESLDTRGGRLLTRGRVGTLAYFEPWGDVVMFHGPAGPYPGLYALGEAVAGAGNIARLSGTITVRAGGESSAGF